MSKLTITLYPTVDYHALIQAVQDHLCKHPVGQMYPMKYTRQQVENWFVGLAENYGASNGVYVSLYLNKSSFDDEDDVDIKKACREVLGIEDRVLLHHSW